MKKIAIIGGGPAGLICAHQLKDIAEVTIFERGQGLKERTSITEGLGGAGSFSDGKFNLSPYIGNRLTEILPVQEVADAINTVDKIFIEYGADSKTIKKSEFPEKFKRDCRANGFSLIQGQTRHWGTDVGRKVIENIIEDIKDDVKIITEASVNNFFHILSGERISVLFNQILNAFDYVIIAVGRSGADWIDSVYKYPSEMGPILGDGKDVVLPFKAGANDIGIRYECENDVFEEFYQWSYEPKISIRSSFDERVRLFCSCLKNGVVALEEYQHLGIDCVNGHSFSENSDEKQSGNANFAILVTTQFTEPFKDPYGYCKSICQTANTLAGGGVLVQSYADFCKKRRSTWKRIFENGVSPSLTENVVPGDLSYAIPYRQMVGIAEFIEQLEGVFPGVSKGLMYFPEVKMYANEAIIDEKRLNYMGNPNIFPVGDCSAWTRSLAGAAAHAKLVSDRIKDDLRS